MLNNVCQGYLRDIMNLIQRGTSQLLKGTIFLSWLRVIVQDDTTRKQFVILSTSTALKECLTPTDWEAIADPTKLETLLLLRKKELRDVDKVYADLANFVKECKALETKCPGMPLSNYIVIQVPLQIELEKIFLTIFTVILL